MQELIKSVYDSICEEEDAEEEYGDVDYDLDFNYLMYSTFEDDGLKTHFYSIWSGIVPQIIDK